MSDVVMASSEADARAVDQVREQHAATLGGIRLASEELLTAVATDNATDPANALDTVARWCRDTLAPLLSGEADVLFPAARPLPETRLLTEALLADHTVLTELAGRSISGSNPVRAAGAAAALAAVLDRHVTAIDEFVLPALAQSREVSLSELAQALNQAPKESAESAEPPQDEGHTCTCHEPENAGHPELDARAVPHAIRHATIFGALDAVRPGKGLVLVAPHDPLPLLAQLERRNPDTFTIRYLERGPEAWRLELTRTARV